MTDNPTHVLILCTGNSARSQMAEGLLRARGGNRFFAYSAGSSPSGAVHPGAIQVMAEIGLNIAGHRSKHLNEFLGQSFDYVLTVCDNAAEACPVFPGRAERRHRGFTDPAAAPEESQIAVFRRVRDEIAVWLDELFALGTAGQD
ncbi:MAG: arsenate reductase ArsC [Anaerolineae bacterium]|nr:arsenate reductase ArsC [Anaerolineae bacterium]